MKILVISDEECPALWEYYVPGRLDGFDLIISCGDLKADYLSFLVTMAKCPVLYVHGNHDGGYDHGPPEGCDCIDDKLLVYNGVRILGLGGCRKYHPGPYQYTEKEMRRRIRKLRFHLCLPPTKLQLDETSFSGLCRTPSRYPLEISPHRHSQKLRLFGS